MIAHSESINEIGAALAKAQGELENASKNAVNPHFRSRYSDLAELLNVIRPVLSKHGIAITQHPSYDGGHVYVETMLVHSSGQWIRSVISCPVGKADAQGVGSAITYMRRYSSAAAVGISQEDDDGNAASVSHAVEQVPAPEVKLDPAILAALEAAKTTDELKAAWSAIPVGFRHGYTAAKDKAKARIAGAAA